ncbi:hypothetical protein SPRA44_90200 [Serratia proteamaculans]|nr:hypothetical protein SPRA44_90200 [Serratia proteamaculans]
MPTPFFMLKIQWSYLQDLILVKVSYDRHKKACGGRLFALQRGGARLGFFRVRLSRNNIARLYNHSRDGLMRGEGAATVNVLALVIALFGRFTQVTAGTSMGHATAKWTVHHS